MSEAIGVTYAAKLLQKLLVQCAQCRFVKTWQNLNIDSLGLVPVAVLTELASTAMPPKLVPKTLDASPLVKADL